MFKIEKNIPLPQDLRGRGGKYPWREMEIGDSFFISNEETNQTRIHSAPSYFSLRNPAYKFRVRKVAGGYRIWRIAVETETP